MSTAIDPTAICECGARVVEHRDYRNRWIACLELRERHEVLLAGGDLASRDNAETAAGEQLLAETRF